MVISHVEPSANLISPFPSTLPLFPDGYFIPIAQEKHNNSLPNDCIMTKARKDLKLSSKGMI